MRALVIPAFGPPGVLRVLDVDPPEPGPGEVRVRVRAAGVQPADCAVRRGRMPPGAAPALPIVPGNECAGVVDRLGAGVDRLAVGDEVIGFRTLGCDAEYAVLPADKVAPRDGMPWEEAGALSASGQTAHTAVEGLGVTAGDTRPVHAAAGGVGSAAVQIARALGATVGTAREANHDHLRSLGAIPVAHGDGLVERVHALAPRGVDAALDAIGGDAPAASLALVADPRRVGTLVDAGARAARRPRAPKPPLRGPAPGAGGPLAAGRAPRPRLADPPARAHGRGPPRGRGRARPRGGRPDARLGRVGSAGAR